MVESHSNLSHLHTAVSTVASTDNLSCPASRSLFRSGDVGGALDCYQRASAQYKMAGDWREAGGTLCRMADIYRRQGDLMGAGRLYGEAGSCYRKCSASTAVASYLKVLQQKLESHLVHDGF